MGTKILKENHSCLKIIQVSMFLLFTVFSQLIGAREITHLVRKPASAPEEEVMTVPAFDQPLLVSIFTDDDAGIMAGMRTSLSTWEAREEEGKNYKLTSSGVYQTPSTTEKRQYIANRLLKYADKRLAGEIKNADEGSTLHAVGKVEKSLRPNTEVVVSKYINLKFKARVLQGKAIMEVRNPWVECSTTFAATGKVKVLTKKDFKDMGISSGVEYTANNSEWVAFVDKEITNNIKARLSSTQKDQSIFNVDADKRVEITTSIPFNL